MVGPTNPFDAENLGHESEQEDRSGLRAAILAAARELFNEEGYEATTMRKIAEHIGYSATAIYRHFPDKHSILTELCHSDFAALGASFGSVMAEPEPVKRLALLGKGYIDFGLRFPNHYRLMFMTRKVAAPLPLSQETSGKFVRKGDPSSDAYAALIHTVREVMATGILRPELTDPEAVAQILWACLHGLVSLYLDHCNDEWVDWRSIQQLTDETLKMTMIGLAHPEGQERLKVIL